MRILVGDDTGLVRSVDVEDQKIIGTYGEQRAGMTISCLTRVEEDFFATSHQDNCIRIYSIKDATYSFQTQLSNTAEIVSLLYNNKILYAVQKNGDISTIIVLFEDEMPYLDDPQHIYKVNATQVNRGKLNPFDLSSMIILSKDSNPQIINLNTKEQVWKARNVKNDGLDLQIPIFDVDVDFKSKNEFYVCTAYRKIRLYDDRVKTGKPVIDLQDASDKYAFNSILLSPDKSYLYVSDNAGSSFVYDTRKNLNMIGKLKGANGSVRQMVLSQNHPYIAAVSLDRFVRIYNTNTNKLFRKVYLKHKLTSVAIIDDVIDAEKAEEDPEMLPSLPKHVPQNEVKAKALDMKAKMKNAKLKLTFEKKKKVHKEEEVDESEQILENEYEEDDWNDNAETEQI